LIDHLALLVPSVERAAATLARLGVDAIGARDAFPDEGTAEIYVGAPGRGARLLLMEAIGPGPYRRALERRGPGLHHLALVVGDVEAAVARGLAAGWALKKPGPVSWLGRSGAPLLELLPRGATAHPVVTALGAPISAEALSRLLAPGLEPGLDIEPGAPSEAGLVLDGRRILIRELL